MPPVHRSVCRMMQKSHSDLLEKRLMLKYKPTTLKVLSWARNYTLVKRLLPTSKLRTLKVLSWARNMYMPVKRVYCSCPTQAKDIESISSHRIALLRFHCCLLRIVIEENIELWLALFQYCYTHTTHTHTCFFSLFFVCIKIIWCTCMSY